MGALLLFGAVAMAWFYPLTRERHARVRAMLERKKERANAKKVGLAKTFPLQFVFAWEFGCSNPCLCSECCRAGRGCEKIFARESFAKIKARFCFWIGKSRLRDDASIGR